MSEATYNPNSILDSVKQRLDIEVDDVDFDNELIDYINGVFPLLITQGVSGLDSFAIENNAALWSDFVKDMGSKTEGLIWLVCTYVCLKVRLLFDPPVSSSSVKILEDSIKEYAYYIMLKVEGED